MGREVGLRGDCFGLRFLGCNDASYIRILTTWPVPKAGMAVGHILAKMIMSRLFKKMNRKTAVERTANEEIEYQFFHRAAAL